MPALLLLASLAACASSAAAAGRWQCPPRSALALRGGGGGKREDGGGWHLDGGEDMLDPDTPHPLRTEEWNVTHVRSVLGVPVSRRVATLRFGRDGKVREGEAETGDWKIGTDGLSWTDTDAKLGVKRHHHAVVVWNIFGAKPRMYRGVVSRDRVHGGTLFRPVVGTFHGIGVGEDTADTSYAKRGFGAGSDPDADDGGDSSAKAYSQYQR